MRKLTMGTSFLAACALLAVGSANAETLYGITFTGSDGLSTLQSVSMTTGAVTAIGPIGFQRCGGMAFNASGTLFATCERNDGSNTPVLVRISTTTGQGTEIGPTGMSGAIGDISFRPSDGKLFAYDALNNPTHMLYTVNTSTGAATLVGDTTLSFAGGNGMTFSQAGVLYQSQISGGPDSDLNTLNPATAQPTFVGQITGMTGRLAAMDVDPSSGTIYGVEFTGSSGAGPSFLVTVDPVNLTFATIGATAGNLDALAFGPDAPPLKVPTLGLAGMLGLLLLMVAVAFRVLRGRYTHAPRGFD